MQDFRANIFLCCDPPFIAGYFLGLTLFVLSSGGIGGLSWLLYDYLTYIESPTGDPRERPLGEKHQILCLI
jgi:hypothetical protein